MAVYALNLFILVLGFPAQVLLTRSLSFSSIAVAGIIQSVVLSAVTILLALAGFSYWSMVFGSIAGSIAFVAMLRYYERKRYKPSVDLGLMRELLGFGKHLLVVGIMLFVIFNVDQLVIAGVLGLTSLGYYFVAVRFGRTIGEQISGVANRVLFPTMARIKDDSERLKMGYIQSVRMISIVAVPLTMGLSALSPTFVKSVLGDDWSPAILPLSILCFQGLINSLISPASNIIIAMGKPRYMSIQTTIQAVVLSILFYPTVVAFGVNGICALSTFVSLLVMIYFLFVFSRIFRTDIVQMLLPIAPSLVSGSIMFGLMTVLVQLLSRTLLSLLMLAGIGFFVYLSCLVVFSKGRDIRDIVQLAKDAFK
jgi:PST family polysaccharide transporter/lipopolysaccharide exporter